MMRESESQQQLLKELQVLPRLAIYFKFCSRSPHFAQAQRDALEAALSGEGLRQLQAEIDLLRDKGKSAGGNIMCAACCCSWLLFDAGVRLLYERAGCLRRSCDG